MEQIKREDVVEFLHRETAQEIFGGKAKKMFTAHFIKRTTGERRVMNCRLGVKKYVKGVGLAFDPSKKNLLGVWDAKERKDDKDTGYRFINLETVYKITVNGKDYEVV